MLCCVETTPMAFEQTPPPPSSFSPSPRSPGPGDPEHAVDDAQQVLRALCHELSALVDGAMRYLDLGRRAVTAATDDRAAAFLASAGAALKEAATLLRAVESDASDRRLPMSRLGAMRPVVEAVEHAVELARAGAASRSISIVARIDPEFAGLAAAPIFPVVSNALRNAVGMTPRGGTVEVRARVDRADPGRERAVIEVLDDGPGPSREAEEHAFELGYTTRAGGMGVGLALTRSIMNDLGGGVTLTSRKNIDDRRGGALVAWWPVAADERIGRATDDRGGRAA